MHAQEHARLWSPAAIRTAMEATLCVAVLALVAPRAARAASVQESRVQETGVQETGVQETGVSAITGVTLIDGTGAAPRASSVVLLSGGLITCVGDAVSCVVPEGADVLDGAGLWLIPGLIDAHVHRGPDWDDPAYGQTPEALRFALGVTTVLEAGDRHTELNLADREASAAGATAVPRMFVSGLIGEETQDAYGIQDVDSLAAHLIDRGVDGLKIKVSMSAEQFSRVVAAAHARGLFVWGHTWDGPPPVSLTVLALQAGIDGIAHLDQLAAASTPSDAPIPPMPPIDDPGFWPWTKVFWEYADSTALVAELDRILEAGAWLQPTLVMERYFLYPIELPDRAQLFPPIPPLRAYRPGWTKEQEALRAEHQAMLGTAYRRMEESVKYFFDHGGMLVAGSDNFQPGVGLIEEIRLIREAGVPPMAALMSATRNAAIALGKGDELGTIEVGKRADLVLLAADPLQDVWAHGRVRAVFKAGVHHEGAALLAPAAEWHAARMTAVRNRRLKLVGVPIAGMGLFIVFCALLYHRFRTRRSSSGSA